MAFTYIGGAANGIQPGTSVVVTHGQTINADDLVVGIVHMNGTSNTAAPTSGTGAAWNTSYEGDGAISTGHSYGVYWKAANGTEPSTYTFDAGTSTRISALVFVFRGAAAPEADAALSSSGEETGSNTTECPAITVSDNSVAIAFYLMDNALDPVVTNITESYVESLEDFNQMIGTAYKLYTTGETTNQVVFTSTAYDHEGVHVSWRETGGGGPTSSDVNLHGAGRGILRGTGRGIG